MPYDFDEIIDRRGSGCVKYDKTARGVIPLWAADMDFRTPDFILEALRARLEHPVLGYPCIPKDYFPTIARWVKALYGWEVDPGHICYVPGVIRGIVLAQCALLPKGSGVIIQPPVYFSFREQTLMNGMRVLCNPLREIPGGGYEMDFDSLEKCISDGGRMLLLSNPQNPTGQCWSRETLLRLSKTASRHGLVVISDEIHSEMAHRGFSHVPYASVSPEAAASSITFMAPSKTFNMAGVVTSYAIVPDAGLREKFFGFMKAAQLDYPSVFAIEATLAAYRNGARWRREMLRYVEGNIAFVCRYLVENIPGIRAVYPQASFLMWLDCRGLAMDQKELMRLLKIKAKVRVYDGALFGEGGVGFVRMNVGCPGSTLLKALESIREAISNSQEDILQI